MGATIRDVARRAGVSIKTVSRVLNNSPLVSEETRTRVMSAIDALDFHPNAAARALVLRKSKTIGLVIADITNPFFPEVVRGVEDVANQHNYNVILCNTDENPEKERCYINLLREKQGDGIILAGSRVGPEEIIALGKKGVHVVVINRDIRHPRVGVVAVANEERGYEAVSHLVKIGHTRIAYISGSPVSSSNAERLEGYKRALHDNGIPPDGSLVVQADPTREGGSEAMSILLGCSPRPTAVFAYNDLQAIGAIDAIKEKGLSVPFDIAVVGFDDIQLASFTTPPLTTFRMPKYEMGQRAAEMLIGMINSRVVRESRVVVDPQLIVRESCGYKEFISAKGVTASSRRRANSG